MEQNLTFKNILSECINKPDGEIANSELSKDSQIMLDEANKVMDIIERNWNSLKHAQVEGASTLEWAENRVENIKNKE